MKKILTLKSCSLFLLYILFSICAVAQTWQPLGDDDFNQASFSTATYTSIDVAADGTTYIGYSDYENSKKLSVKKISNGLWTYVGSPGITAVEAINISVKVAPDGTLYVAYKNNSTSKANVLKWDGSAWVSVGPANFSAGGADQLSFAIASDGTPYVGYIDKSLSSKATVQKFNGTAWTVVGTAGFSAGITDYTSIAIAPDGTAYIGYRDYGNSSKATVKKFDGTSWVDLGTAGFSASTATLTSIAIAPDGTPYIGYRDFGNSSNGTVQKFDGIAWVNVGLAGFTYSPINNTLCIALSSDGTPYFGYSTALGTTVQKFNGTTWVNVGAFTPGDLYRTQNYLSLLISSDGTPYVGYENTDPETVDKATVRKYNGSTWEILGGGGFGGTTSSNSATITISKNGTPSIGYADYENGNKATVKKWDGNKWVNVGNAAISVSKVSNTNIATAPGDTTYIFYDENTLFGGAGCVVKKFNGTAWQTVGNTGFGFSSQQIVFAPDTTIYVSTKAEIYKLAKSTNTWNKVGSFGVPTLIDALSVKATIANDNTLYASYTSQFGTNLYDPNYLKLSVEKYDIATSTWSYVGPQYFGDGFCTLPDMQIAPDGTLYIAYAETLIRNGVRKVTVKKYNGTNWVAVGTPRFTVYDPTDLSFLRLIIAANGTLYVISSATPLGGQNAGYKISLMKFDGNDWVASGNTGFTAGEAFRADLAITTDGSKAFTVYSSTNIFAKYLDINSVLPIKIISLNAELNGKSSTNLNWKADEDANSAYYNVQRSDDGRSFTSINIVQAKGAGTNDYVYYDNTAFTSNAKTVFYKLKMFDKDGSFIYSEIVSVKRNTILNRASVYPVPAVNYIIIKTTRDQNKNSIANIYDNAGRLLKSVLLNAEQQQVDVSNLPRGVYYIKLKDGTMLKFQKND